MRLFFGRSNDYIETTEALLYECLVKKNWVITDALTLLKDIILIQHTNDDLYTINPLMLMYGVFDDYVYFIDGSNTPIKATEDSIVSAKLSSGNSLDIALTTDTRIMIGSTL